MTMRGDHTANYDNDDDNTENADDLNNQFSDIPNCEILQPANRVEQSALQLHPHNDNLNI